MTLEEAQAKIVELTENINTLEEEKKNLKEENEKLSKEGETIRQINQQYFLKLTAKEETEPEEDITGDSVISCEDFANTIKI